MRVQFMTAVILRLTFSPVLELGSRCAGPPESKTTSELGGGVLGLCDGRSWYRIELVDEKVANTSRRGHRSSIFGVNFEVAGWPPRCAGPIEPPEP